MKTGTAEALIRKFSLVILIMAVVIGLVGCRGPKPEQKADDAAPATDRGGGRMITPGHMSDPSGSGGGSSPVRDTGSAHYGSGIGGSSPRSGTVSVPGDVEIEVFYMGRKLNLNEPFRVIDTMETTVNIYLTAEGSELRSYTIWGSGPGAPRINENATGFQTMVPYTFTYDSRSWTPDGIQITAYNQNYQTFAATLLVEAARLVPTG